MANSLPSLLSRRLRVRVSRDCAATFGSLRDIVNASKDEMLLCPGFGESKVDKLYNLLREPFVRPGSARHVAKMARKAMAEPLGVASGTATAGSDGQVMAADAGPGEGQQPAGAKRGPVGEEEEEEQSEGEGEEEEGLADREEEVLEERELEEEKGEHQGHEGGAGQSPDVIVVEQAGVEV